jgi:hypothetical protein
LSGANISEITLERAKVDVKNSKTSANSKEETIPSIKNAILP